MWKMFYNASSFNRPLSDWSVNKVTNMHEMFKGASSFNQTLGWCVDDDVFEDPWGDGNIQDAFSGTQCASTSCGVTVNCP